MSISTGAHDPSGPSGHLPSFAGEEGACYSAATLAGATFNTAAASLATTVP